jgi:hypothetical protein
LARTRLMVVVVVLELAVHAETTLGLGPSVVARRSRQVHGGGGYRALGLTAQREGWTVRTRVGVVRAWPRHAPPPVRHLHARTEGEACSSDKSGSPPRFATFLSAVCSGTERTPHVAERIGCCSDGVEETKQLKKRDSPCQNMEPRQMLLLWLQVHSPVARRLSVCGSSRSG